ncbi:hypothetical protein SCHPADRAFT_510843 [Schizopora paradoxa]|uniref:MYND-type domain-containing protein n=1 Tax=Schizopora paradoxa TaxID=27342 RepID=A0A0H2RMB4_9AGAM|nr:hypothetical protein SCHPADRAFT_510843 [Schizopora paradoxa]
MNAVSIFTVDQAKLTSLALLGTACLTCSKIPDELKRCPICRAVSYCSNACQIGDLESHMKTCSLLTVVPMLLPLDDRRYIFERRKIPYDLEIDISIICRGDIGTMKMLLPTIGGELTSIHCDLVNYKPRCAVCLCSADDKRALEGPEYPHLLHCSECRAAFACSEQHRAQYLNEHCQQLERNESFTECEMNKRAFEDSLEIVTRGWTLSETLWFPVRHKSEYAPLPSSWTEWFADPSNLCPPSSSAALNRVRTKQLSIPMTILYGMEQFDREAGDLPLLSSRTELEIAVVGAWEYELLFGGLTVFEEILHCLPSLRRVTLHFVGPDVASKFVGPNGEDRETLEWLPCALCKEKGVEILHTIHPTLFHNYAEECIAKAATGDGPAFQWPDIAVTFNSGMGLAVGMKSGWSPTLEMLAKNGVPTICTSFLEREAEEDDNFLRRHHCNMVFRFHKNPWRSEAVTKMLQTRKGFFSYNNFVQGFRGWTDRRYFPRWDVRNMLARGSRD